MPHPIFSFRRVGRAVVYLVFFQILRGVVADVPHSTNLKAYQDGDEQPMQGFYSAPHIKAPIWQINKFDYDKTDQSGRFLFCSGNYAAYGPSIYSAKDLSLVYSGEEYDGVARVASPQLFKGIPVLTMWADQGIRIWNQQYKTLYHVKAQGPEEEVQPDSHEAYFTDNDTVVMISNRRIEADLSSMGGDKKGRIVQNWFQEIDPVNNQVLFEWKMTDHFNVSDTTWPLRYFGVWDLDTKMAYDYSHMNSVQKTPEGDFLVGCRHIGIFLVDGVTGKLKWILGGKRNMFKDSSTDGRNASFIYQHDARISPSGPNRLTIFDNKNVANGFCPPEEKYCTRGIEIELDTTNWTVKLVEQWDHPQRVISAGRGGIQKLPNGGTLIAWGQNPLYTEHTKDGELVMDVQRGPVVAKDHGNRAVLAYRVFKGNWVGQPTWGPNISTHAVNGHRRVYVSWNGATEVNDWVLLFSNSITDLDGPENVAQNSARMGFETEFLLPKENYSLYARAAALDGNGEIIGSTPAVNLLHGKLEKIHYPITRVKPIEVVEVTTLNAPELSADGSNSTPSTSTSKQPASPGVPPGREIASEMLSPSAAISAAFGAGALLGLMISVLVYVIRQRRQVSYEPLQQEEMTEDAISDS